jgi:glycosyltransferase involved in cell wall biosynthesis
MQFLRIILGVFMKKIAFVSSIPLFPTTGGNRARTLSMMRAAADLGHEIHFVFLPSRRQGDFDKAAHESAYGTRFNILNRTPLQESLYLLVRAVKKLKRKVFRSRFRVSSVDETYFKPFSTQLRALDQLEKFDVVIVQYVYFSAALDAFHTAWRIIDTHDSFHGTLPSSEERRGLLRADTVIAIQNDEAEIFRQLLDDNVGRVQVVSHFIEAKQIAVSEPCIGATFIGSNFDQNNHSLTWFIDKVMPIIRSEEPDFTLRVAGSVGDAVPDAPGVVKLGRVEIFQDAFISCPILVNSITRGTGVKIKLLEAFGAGVPVVSTALGVKGINCEYLKGTLVVPDGNENLFAEQTLRLFRDQKLRNQLSLENIKIRDQWNSVQKSSFRKVLAN